MTDDWKETVRLIFDMMHGKPVTGKDVGIFSTLLERNETAHAVINLIEERHHHYFCEAKEWRNK